MVLEGEVKLSINSTDGKRLSLSIARKGDILGLSSALTGSPYEMTAETLYPSKIAPISRRDFLNFVMEHPEVYQTLMEELSRQYTHGLRAVAHGGAGFDSAGETGASAAGVERERTDDGMRNAVSVFADA